MEQDEPADCMTCMAHPSADVCLRVVEQLDRRIDGMRHVTRGWDDRLGALTLCGLTCRLES